VYLDASDDFVARMNSAKTMLVAAAVRPVMAKEFEFSPP